MEPRSNTSARRGIVRHAFFLVLALSLRLGGFPVQAQEALRNSMAGDAAIAARRAESETLPYTFKSGDFRLLVTPSLGMEYNDNITISDQSPQDDFILQPFLALTATYPITRANLLRVNLGLGYDYYTMHPQYSALRLQSGSEVSFDVYAGDFWFNFHDRFSYTRDPGEEAAVADTATYGGLENTAGLTTTWDLQDVVLTLGYDHDNFLAASSSFEYLDHASELLLFRPGFQVNPALNVGIEGTGSFTAYDQHVLNDSTGWSGGVYADWQPGSYFRLKPRAGYTIYLFDQTSHVLKAKDQDAWYADLTLSHAVTQSISYSFSAGHELRLGIDADSIEDSYVRPSVNWALTKAIAANANLSYEHGKQGAGGGGFEETYDWLGGNIGLSHAITKKLSGSLNYRYTLRSSDLSGRDYSQNVVVLRLTYTLQ